MNIQTRTRIEQAVAVLRGLDPRHRLTGDTTISPGELTALQLATPSIGLIWHSGTLPLASLVKQVEEKLPRRNHNHRPRWR